MKVICAGCLGLVKIFIKYSEKKKKNVFFDGIQLFDTLKVAPRKDLMILKDKMADKVQHQKM